MSDSLSHVYVIVLLHIVTVASIALNFPILRQISGFVYLMFIPGYAILKILKLKEKKALDTCLYSAGLSIAFLMFMGLTINVLYPLVGVSEPLSAIPLTATLVGVTIVLLFVGYRADVVNAVNMNTLHTTSKTHLKAFFFVLPPILSIVGALYDYNILLLSMVVIVAALFALTVFSRKFVVAELYPLAILSIGLGLLLHTTLISKYNLGNDINGEYYVFKLTEIQGYWKPSGTVAVPSQIANFQSDLSVTVLPTIYSVMLNINGELIFKLIFAFILALIPLVIYRVCELQTTRLYAILSAFFFMSTPYSFFGIEQLALERQIVAELFFMLSVFLIVDKKTELGKRKIMFIVFSLALIVSHYSTAYIYLLFVVFAFLLSYRHGHKDILKGITVLFLASSVFSWYIFVSDSPILGLAETIGKMYRSFLIDLLNPAARSSTVFNYLNPSTSSSIVGLAYRLIVYVQNFFLALGILALVVKRKETSFTNEYQYMSILSMIILVAGLVVPRFAPALNFTRLYGISTLFLAPFFALGGGAFFELVKKAVTLLPTKFGILHHEDHQLKSYKDLGLKFVTVILIATFLFQIGFINHITGSVPLSIPLDLDRRKITTDLELKVSFYEVYTPEQDVYSARWYSRSISQESRAYADYLSKQQVLTAYALADRSKINSIYYNTIFEHGTYVYLRLLNVNYDTVVTDTYGLLNTSDFSSQFNDSNKIYSDGASEIYYAP